MKNSLLLTVFPILIFLSSCSNTDFSLSELQTLKVGLCQAEVRVSDGKSKIYGRYSIVFENTEQGFFLLGLNQITGKEFTLDNEDGKIIETYYSPSLNKGEINFVLQKYYEIAKETECIMPDDKVKNNNLNSNQFLFTRKDKDYLFTILPGC